MDMTHVIIVTYVIHSLLEIFTYIFCKAMPNKPFMTIFCLYFQIWLCCIFYFGRQKLMQLEDILHIVKASDTECEALSSGVEFDDDKWWELDEI